MKSKFSEIFGDTASIFRKTAMKIPSINKFDDLADFRATISNLPSSELVENSFKPSVKNIQDGSFETPVSGESWFSLLSWSPFYSSTCSCFVMAVEVVEVVVVVVKMCRLLLKPKPNANQTLEAVKAFPSSTDAAPISASTQTLMVNQQKKKNEKRWGIPTFYLFNDGDGHNLSEEERTAYMMKMNPDCYPPPKTFD